MKSDDDPETIHNLGQFIKWLVRAHVVEDRMISWRLEGKYLHENYNTCIRGNHHLSWLLGKDYKRNPLMSGLEGPNGYTIYRMLLARKLDEQGKSTELTSQPDAG